MSRAADQVLAYLLSDLVPPGSIWPRDPDSWLAELLYPWAAELARVEASMEALLEESDPRSASNLLSDYERVLGPDPAGRDSGALTLGERRQLAYQRWVARGGASVAFFVALAAALGVAITITEIRRRPAGVLRAGQSLISHPEQFVWVVKLAQTSVTRFRAGASRAGDALGKLRHSFIENVLRTYKPAHTTVVFSYRG